MNRTFESLVLEYLGYAIVLVAASLLAVAALLSSGQPFIAPVVFVVVLLVGIAIITIMTGGFTEEALEHPPQANQTFTGVVSSATPAPSQPSQVVASAVGPSESTQKKRIYESPTGPSRVAIFTLLAFGIVMVISTISTFAEINLLQEVADGGRISESQANSNDSRQALIGWIYLAAFVVSAITFLVWISRVSSNLEPLGVEGQQHSPGWAVGSWFVPIVWLYRPYQVMKEIWKGSYSGIRGEGTDGWRNAPVSPLLGFWWAAWLISAWIDNITTRIWFSGDITVESLITSDWISIIANIIWLIALAMVVILIQGITQHQERKFESQPHLAE